MYYPTPWCYLFILRGKQQYNKKMFDGEDENKISFGDPSTCIDYESK